MRNRKYTANGQLTKRESVVKRVIHTSRYRAIKRGKIALQKALEMTKEERAKWAEKELRT